jgi:hypothetical protein
LTALWRFNEFSRPKLKRGELAQAQTPRAQTLLAQWRNGEHHNSWGNWGNWDNWNNWGNAFWPR